MVAGAAAPGATGGLVAVGLANEPTAMATAPRMGTICVDVNDDGVCEAEHAFATVAGPIDGAMSSVGAIVSGGEGRV